ncbi:hypothetical protein ASPWEDRAFT_22951 [Aspergillus wentii DTO 134E9]|uniref:Uncharacterized protein n=1 Tax=Aspergillus wentii DTO 134E9 TaxID=1073089 RepID=A0A1L9S0W8_ASPWE|nr:uncharacterized protein ASPWEDRAFT_22951 [Aspergillus wentii DTO 134E9]KAI9931188.1 hypothetical protein MW887_010848 [Aspergillus wentii]OJJ40804.1 hypothetical protein ASPWEDRAFT_22951 [Aspergillus wentii DTO 134E9]
MDIAIPAPPFHLTLSGCDRQLSPIPSKHILCFSLSSDADRKQLVEYLHIAFHHTVQRLPFLAGSIVPFPPEEGGRPWLRNISTGGAAHLIIKDLSDQISFSDLVKSNFSESFLQADQICPLPQVAYITPEPVDVCRFQANFINGGLLLVVSIIHNIADGRGTYEVLKIFADYLRKAQSGELGHPLHPRTTIYESDRTALVNGNGFPGGLDDHPAWITTDPKSFFKLSDVESTCHTFRITADNLSTLKATASSSNPGEWISTADAVAALIWRSIMIARHRAGILPFNSSTFLTQPVDCRSRLAIPPPYIGNCIYLNKASMLLSTLSDPSTGLSTAARIIRAQVTAVTADRFKSLQAQIEKTAHEAHTLPGILGDISKTGLMLTSHFKFPMHELDFGPAFGDNGYIRAFRLPAKGTFAGLVTILPRCKDGSLEFIITEREVTFRCLLEDEFFGGFATELGC